MWRNSMAGNSPRAFASCEDQPRHGFSSIQGRVRQIVFGSRAAIPRVLLDETSALEAGALPNPLEHWVVNSMNARFLQTGKPSSLEIQTHRNVDSLLRKQIGQKSKCLFWCRLRAFGRILIRTMIPNET